MPRSGTISAATGTGMFYLLSTVLSGMIFLYNSSPEDSDACWEEWYCFGVYSEPVIP